MTASRITRRRALALGAAMAVAAPISACGGGSKGGTASKDLTYWSMWRQGEDQQKVLQAAFDEFQQQTGIKVHAQWTGRQVLQQVAARLNAGDPPDLTDQDGSSIKAVLGKANGARGLGAVYASTVDGESTRVSDVIPAGLIKPFRDSANEPIVAPYEVFGSTMWYNATTHPDLAASPPKTWTEFIALLDSLKAKGRTPIALDGDIAGYNAYFTTWSVIRHGGVGLLARAAVDRSGASFDDPAFLAAATDVEQIVKGGYLVKNFNATKFPAQQNAWASGKSPTDLLLMGTWCPSETGPQAAANFQYRSFPFPTVEGGKGNSAAEAGVIGFAIPAKAKHPEAAQKFIAFFLNKDRLSKVASRAKNLTPRSDAPAVLADYQKEVRSAGDNVFLYEDGANGSAPQWAANVWEPLTVDLFNGKQNAAGFVAKLKSKTVKLYQGQ